MVVTNPPFSLFREYIAQLVRYKKSFLVIGNINAITYKEIFELIQNNEVWFGVNLGRGISGFIGVPITFLHKYNPEQFEIVRFRKGDDGKDLSINGKCPYFRILIKNRLCVRI